MQRKQFELKQVLALASTGVTALTLTNIAQADTILGVYGEANYWSATVDGDFGNSSTGGFYASLPGGDSDHEEHPILSASFEHPVPLIPNVWVRQNNLDFANTASLNSATSVGGSSFNTLSPVVYGMDYSHTDAALYYEILDNWLTLDLGVAAKKLDFDFSIQQGSTIYRTDNTSTIPMLYAKAAFEFPMTGLEASAQVMAISFEDDSVNDANIDLGYKFNDWFKAQVGYRRMEIDVATANVPYSKVTIDGVYAGLTGHF